MKTLQQLPEKFEGGGEVKGFLFSREYEADNSYIYSVTTSSKKHFEVFEKVLAPLCTNFDKREYSENEFKEVYPKAKKFGITAWTFRDYDEAFEKMLEIEENVLNREK